MTAVHQHFYGHHFMMYASQIIMLYTLSVYSAVMPIIFQWNWSREAGRPYCPTLTLSHSGVWPSLKVLVAQLCLTLCDPMDCSPPGSSVHFPDKSTGVGCYFLFQGIFPNQGSNPSLLHCRQTLPSEPPPSLEHLKRDNSRKHCCWGGPEVETRRASDRLWREQLIWTGTQASAHPSTHLCPPATCPQVRPHPGPCQDSGSELRWSSWELIYLLPKDVWFHWLMWEQRLVLSFPSHELDKLKSAVPWF